VNTRTRLFEGGSNAQQLDGVQALAERWSLVEPGAPDSASPYAGAEDPKGEAEPAEIERIKMSLQARRRTGKQPRWRA
jgi:hypothetical protein